LFKKCSSQNFFFSYNNSDFFSLKDFSEVNFIWMAVWDFTMDCILFLKSVVIGTSLMTTSDFVVFETDESNGRNTNG